MITLIDEPTEENLIFGDDIDLEAYDIDEIVDFYCGSHATEEIVQQYLRMG